MALVEIPFQSVSTSIILVLGIVFILHLCANAPPTRIRPPGPRGLPFLGNTFQIRSTHFATYLKDLHARYGGFVYLNVAGQNFFSIGDIDLATELLERRSAMYSSRPAMPFFDRYMDPDGVLWALAKPGENHFWGRKISTTVMKHVRAGHSEPLQRLEAVALVQKILGDGGQDWFEHTNRMSASLNVAAMFGVNSVNGSAPEVAKVLELAENAVTLANPFFTIINVFPIIDDLIPGFIPTPWRTSGKKWRKEDEEGWDELFREALDGKGAQMSTWAAMFADAGKDRRQLVAQFASAAIDTTAGALQTFVLACLIFPEWIEIAQQELDRIVGRDRLPTFKDRPELPFIEAIVRETIRWNSPVRAGTPHVNTADDTVKYRGKEYFIPKGSTIFCSPHVMEHDPSRYDSPDVFRPQRFLDEMGELKPDYRTTSFGFGRRLCVGIPFAERSLWIAIATMLWTFNIRGAVESGTGKLVEYKATDDAFDGRLTNGPLPFPAIFQPRDLNRVSVSRREWEELEKDLNVLLPPLKG